MVTTSTALSPDHVKALDAVRSRLAQLSTSITLLKQQLEFQETLPTWPALQQNAASVEYNLRKVGETMAAHQQMLTSAHAYPLPSFPGTTQENVLQTLLRKKLEPRAEDWIEDALRQAGTIEQSTIAGSRKLQEFQELWNWAGPYTDGVAKELDEADVFLDNYTIAERAAGVETVVTGIRRNLDNDEDDDDDEDEDDAMEFDGSVQSKAAPQTNSSSGATGAAAPLPLVTLLTFISSGDLQTVR